MTSDKSVFVVRDDWMLRRSPVAIFESEEDAKKEVAKRFEHHLEELPCSDDFDVETHDFGDDHKFARVKGLANENQYHVAYHEMTLQSNPGWGDMGE